IVDIKLPRPRTSEIVGSAEFGLAVAAVWNDLREEASRGMRESENAARAQRPIVGFALFIAADIAVEGLLRLGVINRFIVPLPSEVAASFGRLFAEEHLLARFLTTCRECLYAMALLTILGIGAGAVLHRMPLLRRACETPIAALASAPIVLMYPLFLVVFGR